DDIGASISSLRLMTEIIQDPRLNDAKKQEFYYKINETSQKIAQQLNEVIWSLNTQNDTLQSFTEYIKLHCYSFFENSPIQFTYIEQNEFDKSVAVNSTWRKNLFLSIKEIMNNALKHSSATTVTLTIAVYNNIEICIVDNGIGILNNNPFGNGLKNISKRVEAVNGKLEIINNNGTTINISCPIS
ncbi:MAG: hypothetical protein KA319_07285, partial [Ferruginibacter sp.]|nr:hypothetical protein [Ferruginibacter sp.]